MDDPFEDLLELEDEFYKEGYDAGVADSAYAGMIEGKVFGVEKGYEKAIEFAKLHGRAKVWRIRMLQKGSVEPRELENQQAKQYNTPGPDQLKEIQSQLESLPTNSRLQKHIESLLALTDANTVKPDNSDESVTHFDERVAKANAKAKVIANIAGESLSPAATTNSGIEDATGLNARH